MVKKLKSQQVFNLQLTFLENESYEILKCESSFFREVKITSMREEDLPSLTRGPWQVPVPSQKPARLHQ